MSRGRFRLQVKSISVFYTAILLTIVQPLLGQEATNCVPTPDGLVAWWAAEGNASDRAALNPGTPQGAVTFESGQVGNGFVMHGGFDAVKIAATDSLNVGLGSGMTIEAWVNPQNLSIPSPLVEWNHEGTNFVEWGVHFWILKPGDFGLGPGSLFANLADVNGTAHFIWTPAGTMVTGVWQHVAITYDRTSGLARLYRNGGIVAEANLGIFQPETGYNVFLGRRPAGDSARSYLGSLDEVSIYSRPLPQTQIQDIYNGSTLGKCPVVDPDAGQNHPPSISKIPDRYMTAGKSTGPIGFTVADVDTVADNLLVTGSSSDPVIIPDANISLGGSGGNRTVNITAATNQIGTVSVTLTVSDGEATRSISFSVSVNPSQPPTIAPLADHIVLVDEPTAATELHLTDPDTALTALRLTGSSSNPALVPNANIFFGMANGKWYVTVTPVFGQLGTARITASVSDGTDTARTDFAFTVNAPADGTTRFLNAALISIPAAGAASPYPSVIDVAGMHGTISNLIVSIDKFNHSNIHDVNMLLVAPSGEAVVIFSHVSGNRPATNVRVYLTDTSGFFLPDNFALWSEPLKPAAFAPAPLFPSPAPAAPYRPVALSSFNGLSPNGTWSLYVYDDTGTNAGSIVGGWSLLISTTGGSPPTISDIPDQSVTAGATTKADFTINDPDSTPDQLILSAESSNPALVPVSNIVFGGSGSNRTVSVTAPANQSGSAVITVTVSDGELSASDSFTLQVERPPLLTVTVDSTSRHYGAANPIFTGRLVGLQSGDQITATYNCAATAATPVGDYAITPLFSDPENKLANYEVLVQNGTLTVTPAALIGTPLDKSRAYGQTNPPCTVSYTGFVNGENAAIISGDLVAFSPANTNSPPGTYPLFVSGQAAPNYSINYTQGTLTVTGAVLLIQANNATRSYGAANPELTGSLSGLQNGDNILASYATTANTTSAGVYPITPVLTDPDGKLSNYTIVIKNGTLTVTRAVLTISADDKSKVFGTDNPVLTGSITGIHNLDNITPRYATAATRLSPPDNYLITPSLADPDNRLSNYRVTKRYGTLTVTLVPASLRESPTLEISANDETRPYGTGNPQFTGTISGLENGDNISATYTSSATAGSPVDIYAITPEVDDPDGKLRNYTLITTEGALTVDPVALDLSIDDKSRPYGAANPAFSGTVDGLLPGDKISVTYTTTANPSSPVGNYLISSFFNDPDAKLSNYALSVRNGMLAVRTAGAVKITSITWANNYAQVLATGDANVAYTIQASLDLISWSDIGTVSTDASGRLQFHEGGTDGPAFRAFRVFLP